MHGKRGKCCLLLMAESHTCGSTFDEPVPGNKDVGLVDVGTLRTQLGGSSLGTFG